MCGNTGRLTYGDELLVVLVFAGEMVVGRHSGKGEEFLGGHVAGWRGGGEVDAGCAEGFILAGAPGGDAAGPHPVCAPLPFEHLAGAPFAFSLVWLGGKLDDEVFVPDS